MTRTMIRNIIWYILLPFIALYRLIADTTKNMSANQKFLFYLLLAFIIIQVYDLIIVVW